MKANQMLKTASLKTRIVAFPILLFAMLSVKNINAQQSNDSNTSARSVKISHLGTAQENLFFQVQIQNVNEEKLNIAVRDENGENLYRTTTIEKNFVRNFRLPKEFGDNVTFLVWSSKDKKPESFEIRTRTQSYEEVIVERVE